MHCDIQHFTYTVNIKYFIFNKCTINIFLKFNLNAKIFNFMNKSTIHLNKIYL